MGDQLRAGERTIRELVIFSDEEITDEVIEERADRSPRRRSRRSARRASTT